MRVRRFDKGELGRPVKDESTGYLMADGRITKTGVFDYDLADGTRLRELRLPEEVFSAKSMATFDDVPLTNGHPAKNLTARNTSKHQVGSSRNPQQDGVHMKSKLRITDEKAISDAQGGKRELSCGYTAELEMRAGVTDGIDGIEDGLRYDAIQRNIRGNHVALVGVARGGPSLTVRLDRADGIRADHNLEPERGDVPPEEITMSMVSKRIDGVDIEFSKQGAQAVDKLIAVSDGAAEKIEKANTEAQTQTARADKAEEELTALKKDTADKLSDAAIAKRVAARVKLVTDARDILGDKDADGGEIKLDGMTDAEIKSAVILKVHPEAKLDERDASYIEARFDGAIESAAQKPKQDSKKPHPGSSMRNPRVDGAETSGTARDRMIKRNQDAWQGNAAQAQKN